MKRYLWGLVIILSSNQLYAAGNTVGTAAVHDLIGLYNIYYQRQLGQGPSSIMLQYAHLGSNTVLRNVKGTSFGLSYKKYQSKYQNSFFWQMGIATFQLTSHTAKIPVIPILLTGRDWRFKNTIIGFEAGIGTAAGLGLIGFNAAFDM